MEITYEDFAIYLSALDPALQNILVKEETGMTITDVANSFNLNFEERDLLSDEVLFTLMGMSHPRNFENNLIVNLGIGERTASQITEIIVVKLFDPVQEELFSLYNAPNLKEEDLEVSEKMDSTSQSEPEEVFMHASAVPVYRPDHFGQARSRNEEIPPVVKTGPVSYQSGVSLKDTLFGAKAGSTVTDPRDSSFAKKLETLGQERGSRSQKEDPYGESSDI